MRQQQIGGFRAFVQRKHRDHGPARAPRLHGLDEGVLLALAQARIGGRRGQRNLGAAARKTHHCNTDPDQRT